MQIRTEGLKMGVEQTRKKDHAVHTDSCIHKGRIMEPEVSGVQIHG